MALQIQQAQNAVVIDIGSNSIKIGYAADPCPQIYPSSFVQDTLPTNPENLAEHIIQKLPPDSSSLPLIFIIPKYIQTQALARFLPLFFTHSRQIFLYPTHLALLWSSNRTTCVIADFGHRSTRIYSSIDGQVRKMQKLDYFPQHQISDGGPELPGYSKYPDIPITVIDVIKAQIVNLRSYQKNIDVIITGGGSLTTGFDFRISALLPGVRIVAGRERCCHAWLGGAVGVGCQFQGQQGINQDNFQETIERGQIWSEW
ncbi:Actin related protein [Spironucleus salmonicida]|uniref:Actin related protein n=1 Tax=Spironucleus salmonicida TaxID=348837 RepID=V6LS68_9EUKA|nr:Actin related protein [Spironucleus salmonicida]|eukprot:EST43624.1 Actin related protein [Spironucleus salmonicida]